MRSRPLLLLGLGCALGCGPRDLGPACADLPGGFTLCEATGVEVSPTSATVLPTSAVNAAVIADYDGDGRPDAFVYNWAGLGHLWLNRGGLHFEDGTEAAGIAVDWALGAAAGDLDNDGRLDLVVTLGAKEFLNRGPGATYQAAIRVFRNLGDGHFEDMSLRWGFGPVTVPASVALMGVDLADVNLDGRLDVIPRLHLDSAGQARLYLSRPGPSWTESGQATLGAFAGSAFATLSSDIDDDGLADLFLLFDAGDGAPARFLHRVAPSWPPRFVEESPVPSLFGDGADRADLMAGAAADFDGDGQLDLFVTDIGPQHLLRGLGGTLLEDVAAKAGATANPLPDGSKRVVYDAAFVDYDNDGWPDLALTASRDRENVAPPYPSLHHNRGDGTFEEVTPLLRPDGSHDQKALAASDLDGDGRVDLWFGGANEAPRILRNQTDAGRAIEVRLEGHTSNREGVGARVTVTAGGRRQVREVSRSGNPYSPPEPRLHFGLGSASRADGVEVRWPSGFVQASGPIAAGSEAVIVEPELVRVEPEVVAPGEEVRITVRPALPDGSPAGPGHRVEIAEDGRGPIPVADGGDGGYRATFRPAQGGLYGFSVSIDGKALLAHPNALAR